MQQYVNTSPYRSTRIYIYLNYVCLKHQFEINTLLKIMTSFLGFGFDLAVRLNSLGCTVYAGCLFPKGDGAVTLSGISNNRMHVLDFDVTNDSHIVDSVKFVRNQGQGKTNTETGPKFHISFFIMQYFLFLLSI